MSKILSILFFLLVTYSSSYAQTNPQAMIILDASGSMWGQVDGRDKMTIAKEALSNSISNWRESADVGLMIFGHSGDAQCSASEIVMDLGRVDDVVMLETLRNINPEGKGSISNAVMKAARAMDYSNDKATIILISDGQDGCENDPCATLKAIEKEAMDFKVHVIGFAPTDENEKQLQCLAKESGGKYFSAVNTEALNSALKMIIEKVQSPLEQPREKNVVLSASEKDNTESVAALFSIYKVVDGRVETKESAHCHSKSHRACQRYLDEGRYRVKTEYKGFVKESPLHVKKGKPIHLHVTLNETGRVKILARQKEGGERLKATHTLYKIRNAKAEKKAVAKCNSDLYESCMGRIATGQYLLLTEASGFRDKRIIEVSAGNLNQVEVIMGEIGRVQISSRVKSEQVKAFHTLFEKESMKRVATCFSDVDRACEVTLRAGKYRVRSEYNNQIKENNFKLRGSELEHVRVVFSSLQD